MPVSWNSYLLFERKIKERRYLYDKETLELFDMLLTTAKERIELIPKGQQYWRAQLGFEKDPLYDKDEVVDYTAVPFAAKRMKPLADKACEGRINPKGIPCLYLSTVEKTAISEIRPPLGSCVTVAQFETIKDLEVIDCSRGVINPMDRSVADLDKLWKLDKPTEEEALETIWRWIDLAFSKPVDRKDDIADYAPTQIIAELFKTNGFDGIKYKSLFDNGVNLALYDINSAKQVDGDRGKVFEVTKVVIDSKQTWPIQFKQREEL